MTYVVWGLVILLLILHQDDWFFNFWQEPRLVFGFMPATLLYHVCISIAASITWFLATKYAWPLEENYDPPSDEEAPTA